MIFSAPFANADYTLLGENSAAGLNAPKVATKDVGYVDFDLEGTFSGVQSCIAVVGS